MLNIFFILLHVKCSMFIFFAKDVENWFGYLPGNLPVEAAPSLDISYLSRVQSFSSTLVKPLAL